MKDLVDFTVTIKSGKNPVILQLTDPQIIDAGQSRYADRLSEEEKTFWASDKVEERCYRYMRETIQAVEPDLILLTGDMVYGEFDDSGARLLELIDFMECFGIWWAPVFGNHDAESQRGADWQCARLQEAKHCLFRQRSLTGNGNYTVGIVQDNVLKRVFVMLDSNGSYHTVSEESLANGHTTQMKGFGEDQIAWFQEVCRKIKAAYPKVKLSFVFHIQPYVFKDAFEKYGFRNENTKEHPINIDAVSWKIEGDFGYLGNNMKSVWDKDYVAWNCIKEMEPDSIIVGHEHSNSGSVVYEGIRFQYGQKSSEYDRYNSLLDNGDIVGGVHGIGTPLVGGTVIPLSKEDGSIENPFIYLCKDTRRTER